MSITVVGAGFAGCEAAYILAENGVKVKLYEMKPKYKSAAHSVDLFAELVCSNSFKASRLDSAAGLLKWEMQKLGSVCVKTALKTSVPAGGALAVDRNEFSSQITDIIKNHKNIEVIHKKVDTIPQDDYVIIATGPLTDGELAENIKKLVGCDYLNFFDAAAPIVTAESVDFNKVFSASRYEQTVGDYFNCPFNREEYLEFHNELVNAESVIVKDFDVYEGCMPIEVLAKRGTDAIRFGPMKPVGLINPATGHRPWAAVQLRKENSSGTLFNLVGFQTNLKFGEQKRVFSMIPGLENAEFVRYGVMHRNSFIDSPRLLNADFSLKEKPNVYFAGQISGVEGYMESAMSGLVSGISVLNKLNGKKPIEFPDFTMIGALCGYISDSTVKNFQPMGANYGVIPSLCERIKDKRERYARLSDRSVKWYEREI